MPLRTRVHVYLLEACFQCFCYISRSGIAVSYGNSLFNSLRNRQTSISSRCLTNVGFLPPPLTVSPPDSTSEISIAYKVLEVFPKACRVLITCHSPHASLPITYSLWGTGDTEVAKKTVKTQDPASFSINVTLKSRPDLLTYFCQAATTGGKRVVSTKLQMYWELWASEYIGVGDTCGVQGLEDKRSS